jgi:uncharacterized protein HemY
MKAISGLFLTLLLFVIGAGLIASVNTSVSAIVTPTYSSSVVSLSALLPLLFVVMIILYGFRGFESLT